LLAGCLLEDHKHIIADHKHIIKEQQKLLRLMEEKLRLARQKRFGASSEKLPFQGDFFDEAELEVALGDIEQQIQEQEKSKPKRKPRAGFSDKLQRVRVELPLRGTNTYYGVGPPQLTEFKSFSSRKIVF
jgi:transposase